MRGKVDDKVVSRITLLTVVLIASKAVALLARSTYSGCRKVEGQSTLSTKVVEFCYTVAKVRSQKRAGAINEFLLVMKTKGDILIAEC